MVVSPGGAPRTSYTVQLANATTFRGAASSISELFQVFQGLAPSEKLDVFISGIIGAGSLSL